jgi:hypothetical protein
MPDQPTGATHESAFAERLANAVSTLPERDSQVLRLHYGLDDRRWWTLEEIGGQLGISKERVRQLVNKALQRLRQRGQRELRNGSTDKPSAALVQLSADIVGDAEDPAAILHVARFVHNELGWMHPTVGGFLLVYLAGATRKEAKAHASKVHGAYQTIAKEIRPQQTLLSPTSSIGRFRALLNTSVLWPPTPHAHAAREDFRRQRDLSRSSGFRLHTSDKLGRKVQCQAGEEPAFYALLDRLDTVAWYQEQPLRIPYRLDGAPRNYYPDVLIGMADGRGVVTEIKPNFRFGVLSNLLKWVALWEYCIRCGYGMFVGDRRHSIQQVMARPIPVALEQAFLQALAVAPLDWPACKDLLRQHGATSTVLIPLVLRNGLSLRQQPFRLGRELGEQQQRVLGLLQQWRYENGGVRPVEGDHRARAQGSRA